jgi:alpha-tubulin suppressor-like RCC1 family protein
VPFQNPIDQVSVGDYHAALVSESLLYTWGCNSKGQLGTQHPGFSEAVSELKVQRVSCGSDYTMVLTETGELMVAG